MTSLCERLLIHICYRYDDQHFQCPSTDAFGCRETADVRNGAGFPQPPGESEKDQRNDRPQQQTQREHG